MGQAVLYPPAADDRSPGRTRVSRGTGCRLRLRGGGGRQGGAIAETTTGTSAAQHSSTHACAWQEDRTMREITAHICTLQLWPFRQRRRSSHRPCAPGWSPNRRTNGSTMPRLFSTASCALRILEAATIFMALVILPMFLIARIRCLTAGTHGANTQQQPAEKEAQQHMASSHHSRSCTVQITAGARHSNCTHLLGWIRAARH